MKSYALVSNGSVDASEMDRADAEVVDVMFSWGQTVLEVKHLAAGEDLVVGETDACDLMIPADVLGTTSARIVKREGSKIVLVPPVGATSRVDGFMRSESAFELSTGHVGEMTIGAFTLRFSVVAASKKIPAGLASGIANNDGLRSVVGSAFVHAMLIGAVALFMPSLNSTDNEDIDRDRAVMIQKMLNVSAQRELEQEQQKADNAGGNTGGDTLKDPQAAGDPGKMGKVEPTPSNGKWGSQGEARPQDATLARQADREAAKNYGLLGMLDSLPTNDPNAPVVPWGTVNNGADSASAMGSMFGSTIGDASGTGGLNLWGTGEGGGGNAQYIGLNGLNGLSGPGNCVGPTCNGIGSRTGLLPGGHIPKAPPFPRVFNFHANGRLDPQVIQRIIQQNSGRFRQCYAMALTANPSLEGHVGVKFIIDRTGAVSAAVDSGSTIPDASVTSCVVRTFPSISFPAPDDGMVTVTYGFAFSPGQ